MPKYTRQCEHVHLSGRPCGYRVGRNAYGDIGLFCGFHKGPNCLECQSMMDRFTPKKGWGHG